MGPHGQAPVGGTLSELDFSVTLGDSLTHHTNYRTPVLIQ